MIVLFGAPTIIWPSLDTAVRLIRRVRASHRLDTAKSNLNGHPLGIRPHKPSRP